MRIVALIAAYNEADVIGQVLDELIGQRIDVHFVDNASTDDTARIAAERLGRGVLAVERYPAAGNASDFPWAALLARKEELAATLDADWFLHHDADEIRESPWSGVGLREGIELVDRLGFDAIDFEVLHFRPTDDRFAPGADLRATFDFFEAPEPWDRVQIKAWKRQPAVDLVASGGHEAVYPERRVFPVRFLCRHYPIRSPRQGERKLLGERLPRFRADELERGWHRQYEQLSRHRRLLWRERDLIRFDPERVRAELWIHNREWEAAAGTPVARAAELLESERRAESLSRRLDERNREVDRLTAALDDAQRAAVGLRDDLEAARVEVAGRREESARLIGERDAATAEAVRLGTELDGRHREVERLGIELDGRNREAARLGGELDRRNREVERLGLDLDARNREAARLGVELDLRNREVERLSLELDARNREAARLGVELDLRNRELASRAIELDSARAALDAERVAARTARDGAELDAERLRHAVARLEAEVESAREERAAVAAELERLLASRTWRWSRPLRSLFWRLPRFGA